MSKTEHLKLLSKHAQHIADKAYREYVRRRVELTSRECKLETRTEIKKALAGFGWTLSID